MSFFIATVCPSPPPTPLQYFSALSSQHSKLVNIERERAVSFCHAIRPLSLLQRQTDRKEARYNLARRERERIVEAALADPALAPF